MFITQKFIESVIALIANLLGKVDIGPISPATIPSTTLQPTITTPSLCNTVDCLVNHTAWTFLPEACGARRPEKRITNGKQADLGQFPWIARIGYKGKTGVKFQCGATIVNEWFVVTAAHCLKGHESRVQVIRFGEHTASTDIDCEYGLCAPPVQDIEPSDIVLHPKYPQESRYDIAVIKLKTKVNYNDFVQPICLSRGDPLKANHLNESTTVAGWGIIDSSTEEKADTLMYVNIPVRENEVCDKLYDPVKLDDSQLCVGVESGEDSCTGDSGGPLMNVENDKYFLLGVVSFGKAYCGESPSVYTNVPYFMPWILDNIAKLAVGNVGKAPRNNPEPDLDEPGVLRLILDLLSK